MLDLGWLGRKIVSLKVSPNECRFRQGVDLTRKSHFNSLSVLSCSFAVQQYPFIFKFYCIVSKTIMSLQVMELESGVRKRARGVLELSATHAAIKSSTCSPTLAKIRVGLRTLSLSSKGKCVCGHLSLDAVSIHLHQFLYVGA